MASDPTEVYKSTQIETASREQILLMLYDGAIRFMRQAREAMKEEDYQVSHNKLIKSQDIVTELMASLEIDIMGDVGKQLYNLYDYILHNLVQANVDKDVKKIDAAVSIMQELQEAWDEIINEKGMTYEKAKAQSDHDKLEKVSEKASNLQSSSQPQKSPDKSSSTSQLEDTPYGDLSVQG